MEEDNLYPQDYEQEVIDAEDLQEDELIGYRPGIAFSWETGDFMRDGTNQLLEASGIESWQQWIRNCLQTERYKHLAYSDDFGIELDQVFAASTSDEAESILTRQIAEALLADPYGRTAYIDDITYDWQGPDSVLATLVVVGIADVTIDMEVNITNGGA